MKKEKRTFSKSEIQDQYLDFAEFQAKRRQPMYMTDWARRLDDFLEVNRLNILDTAGKITAQQAKEIAEVEQPFLQQLASLGWTVIDQGREIPQDPGRSLRRTFRRWILPDVFSGAVSAINTTVTGEPWLTDKQLHDQILSQPNRTLLEANEAVQKLLFKAQVDSNEITGEQDPVVRLIDFAEPENNQFHAVNQFRIDTPGCVKQFIISATIQTLIGTKWIR